jgi:uncharacterized repeat protein (TIGR03806 family)
MMAVRKINRSGFLSTLSVLLLLAVAGCTARLGPVTFHAQDNPTQLSDWHLLQTQGDHLALNDGVVPYDLNTPLFSDYAHKLRTIWLPKGTIAHYDAERSFDFPVGTIISKTFYYPVPAAGAADDEKSVIADDTRAPAIGSAGLPLTHVRLIETRLLVRRQDGWATLPYVWNKEQTDAVLSREGDEVALTLERVEEGRSDDFTYVVPNVNQCAGCHATNNQTRVIVPIGLKARHLNRDYAYAAGVENQLQHLVKLGYLDGLPALANVPRNADWQDTTQPLERRARAYLDINCGHCHNPQGPANTSGLTLDIATVENLRLGVCKPPVAAGQGTGDHIYDVVPGKPADSILAYRLGSIDPGAMMPEVGRATRHVAGLALIDAWIASIPGDCTQL